MRAARAAAAAGRRLTIEARRNRADARLERPDGLGERARHQPRIAHEPGELRQDHILNIAVERQLGFAADLAVERVDRGVEIEEAEGIPHRRVGARHQGRVEAGFTGETRRDGRAGAVDDRIRQLRGDDFAAQAVALDVVREALAHRAPGNSA